MMHIGIAGPIQINYLTKQLLGIYKLPYAGMLGTPATNLAIGLWKKGHKISLFTLDKDQEQNKLEIIQGERIKIYIGCYRKMHRMRDFFKLERKILKEAMLQDEVQIINAQWSYEFAMATIESEKYHLITCRDEPLTILKLCPDLYRLGRLLMALWVFRNGKNFSSNSPYLAKALRLWGVNSKLITPNFINDSWFNNTNYNNFSSPRIIAINNGWSKLKNVRNALRAFAITKKKYTNIEFDLYGSDYGPGGKAEQWALSNQLAEGVNFIGYKPSDFIQEQLPSYSMLLHTSLEESFGLIFIEAMASKVPIVAGKNSGAIPWVLNHGKAGVLVDVKDPLKVAQGIEQVLFDKTLRQNLIYNGYKRALNNFSSDVVISQYETIFENIINSKNCVNNS